MPHHACHKIFLPVDVPKIMLDGWQNSVDPDQMLPSAVSDHGFTLFAHACLSQYLRLLQ